MPLTGWQLVSILQLPSLYYKICDSVKPWVAIEGALTNLTIIIDGECWYTLASRTAGMSSYLSGSLLIS